MFYAKTQEALRKRLQKPFRSQNKARRTYNVIFKMWQSCPPPWTHRSTSCCTRPPQNYQTIPVNCESWIIEGREQWPWKLWLIYWVLKVSRRGTVVVYSWEHISEFTRLKGSSDPMVICTQLWLNSRHTAQIKFRL